MNKIGRYNGATDNEFSDEYIKALEQYQAAKKLAVIDGIFGYITFRCLLEDEKKSVNKKLNEF